VTVAYGQEILKDNPNARFVQCDVRHPEVLLKSPVVKQLFGDNHKFALGFNGIAWFLRDEEIAQSLKALFDWAPKGTLLYFCDSYFDGPKMSPDLEKGLGLYAKMGQPYYIRSLDTIKKLVQPWKVREPGFRELEEWIGIKGGVAKITKQEIDMSWLGAILEK
jgi:hypothetical protein